MGIKLVEYCNIACAQLSTYKYWRHMHINCTNTNTHTTIFSCLDVSQWNTVWHDDIAVAKPSTTSCSACQPEAYICKGKKVEPNFRLPGKEKNTTRRRNKNSWRCVSLLCHTKLHHFRIFDFALIWSLFFFFPSSPKRDCTRSYVSTIVLRRPCLGLLETRSVGTVVWKLYYNSIYM